MHPEKAPGPDGYTGLFFRTCWDTVKYDLIAALRHFQGLNTQNLFLLNSAVIALLPKHQGAVRPQDFRPISLIHFFAKLIAKMMAARLQPWMNKLTSPCQNAFIKGRSIHDNFVYVQAMAKTLRQKKIPSVMLKLDITKAFDSVSWEFLLKLLQGLGFGPKWRGWISALFFSASTRILVNSKCTQQILHRKGLRQGDPLSPLLFVLVVDCLGRLMDKAQRNNILSPLGNQLVKHRASIYADDVIIFLKPEMHDFGVVTEVLKLFGEATGLITNLAKSKILPIRCDGLDLTPLQLALGCQLASFPCTYLGMPLSDRRLKLIDFQDLLDKLIKKIAGWKARWISSTGRMVLVRFVLSAMPIFMLLAVHQPKWVIKQIDKLRRAFLWSGSDAVCGGKCLVRWTQVCSPISVGGLGIHDLQAQGRALKVRWLWQSITDPDKPWQGLQLPVDKHVKALFIACTSIKIGSGIKISFWHDHWLNGEIPAVSFPNLFKHSKNRRISLAEGLTNRKWVTLLKRNPGTEVLREYIDFWHRSSVVTFSNLEDEFIWKWSADGRYNAKSAYLCQFWGRIDSPLPEIIWHIKVPPRIRFFSWLFVQGKCLTADNLAKRGWPHNPICQLCHLGWEDGLHLVSSCPFTAGI